MVGNSEELLSRSISGFHQYVLQPPAHLVFVSRSLCEMTGFAEAELLSEDEDRYALLVHPADRAAYAEFIDALCAGEPTRTLQYRLVKKDGIICHVSDTVNTERLADGTLVGHSVLTDITRLKTENDNLQFLNETIPCGFLKYTCEKQPKLTYINEQMLQMLRFPEMRAGELDYLELCKENIYLMIPMEERRRFSLYLNRVSRRGAPIAGEMTVLRCDGTKAHLFGWVTKCVNEQGVEEFQSVCMDVTERYRLKKANETKRYLKALSEVYDQILEYDMASNTVKWLYGQTSAALRWLEGVPMQLEDATGRWIEDTVVADDRAAVREFFGEFCSRRSSASKAQPPKIRYRVRNADGTLQRYTGVFVKIDTEVSLFCCRHVPDTEEAEQLRSENDSLKTMQELVMRFSDGIAAFEVTDEYVTPLYASDNVCEFFGFTREEWLPMMQRRNPLRAFATHGKTAYEDIQALLKNGEAEFTYFDLGRGRERRIKAICSERSADGDSPRYVMLYKVDDDPSAAGGQRDRRGVSIRTFGYFDVFVDGKPIAFRSQKSKELFALLVDRRGGYVSSEEAISFLWEDEPVSPVTLARYRKVALRLKNILEEYGISEVVEAVDGKRRIVVDRVQCDLYDYLTGKAEFAPLFKGSYLTNYSWGETTLGELTGDSLL